jgi:hypothetical protein
VAYDISYDHLVGWEADLRLLTERVAGSLFTRPEPRATFADLVRGLLADVPRKNSWQLTEHVGHGSAVLPSLERGFDNGGRMRIPAGTATPRRQSGLPRASMSRQVQQQRRGYAQAVLRALARSQRGRPIPQMQRVLRDALSQLGVRLSPAVLQDLAAGIAAGRPVELP